MDNPWRFEKTYGTPAGRSGISTVSLERRYDVEKTLDPGDPAAGGVGACNGGVFVVRNRKSGKRCVHKKIPSQHKSVLEREILLLQVLRHPNIVGYVDAFITEHHPVRLGLYMEYCDLGSLQNLLDSYCSHYPAFVPESFVWHILHSLTSALQYLHHGIHATDHRDPPKPCDRRVWPIILHRDIKPDNIFLRSIGDEKSLFYPHWPFGSSQAIKTRHPSSYPKIVLADFGLATARKEPDFNDITGRCGTIQWQPPETPECTARGEVWVIGAVALCFCRRLKYGPLQVGAPRGGITERWCNSPDSRKGIQDLGPGREYSPHLATLLNRCLKWTTSHRPLSYELMVMIRKAEAEIFESGMVRLEALPKWALKR